MLALFDEALALGERLMTPRVVYRAVAGRRAGGADLHRGRRRAAAHPGRSARLWGPLEAVGAGICTVGDAIETRVRALFDERELPLAVMLDSVGSAAVESLAEYANDLLCQAALSGGLQGDQPDQPGLRGLGHRRAGGALPLCPGEPIGVTLNEACFMTPGKSITFLVGIGPRGAGGSLLHPVPALLDARLRLPPRSRRHHGAPVRVAGVVVIG